jgi:hypothetical protein
MATAKEGNVDAFRALVFAGANVKLCNKRGAGDEPEHLASVAERASDERQRSDLADECMSRRWRGA